MLSRTLRSVVLVVAALAPAAALAQAKPAELARADIQKTFGFVPGFVRSIPEVMLPGAWEELKGLQLNPNTALDGKTKELIGLAVASQIPCKYCTYGHSKAARANGATDAEVGEAVSMAALTRHWSTFFNGIQLDEAKFRGDIARVIENVKKGPPANPPAPVNVVDAASALKDAEQSFGFAPEFLKRFPADSTAGAWKMMRDVEMNPKTALPGKVKSLISIAVAAQVPCKYCLIADTEFARLEGATDKEISEAVAMASLVRTWSTMLHGLQVDEASFRKDIDRMLKGASSAPRGAAR